MITQWFLSLWQGIASWAIGLFGTNDPPAFLTQAGTFVSGLLNSAVGLGVWIPWALVISVAGINLALWASGFLLKAARWLVGLVPTMGGG